MNAIEVKNISKKFKEKTVFKNLSFNVKAGEITAIVGPSGQGKSTLLRILIGLEKADEGTIKIDGKLLMTEGKYKNKKEQEKILEYVSIVFQEHNLFPNLTALNNLKIVKNDIEKIKKLLKEFGLEGKEDLFPAELSGGQKQRLSIIRALLPEPKILLFDEPTSSLDDNNREIVAAILKSLKEQSYTIILVTHDEKLLNLTQPIVYYMKDNKFFKNLPENN